MRANPGESSLVLTAESDLEREAMRRWAGRVPSVEEWREPNMFVFPLECDGTFTLAFRGAPGVRDNVVTAPKRTVRVPWPGQRVEVRSGDVRFKGKVARIEIDPIPMMGDVWVHVASEGGWNDGAYPPEDVTIIGDDHRWVEIVLPEEGS